MSRRVAVTREVAPMPQPQPLVSVIIPTRNRARLLRRSIASVLGQSWRNLEVIVVDDGSTDDTAAALAACADPRLHVLRREQGSSAAAARNAGIAAARGDYLAFNDDDDIWLPHKLEYQMGALLAAGAGYGLCLCSRVLMQQTHARLVSGAQLAPELDFSRGNGRGGPDYSLIATPSWVVRREALERAGHFDERLITWEDWELALRLWLATDVLVVDVPLYVQDQIEGGNLYFLERPKVDAMHVIEAKHGSLWQNNAKVRARHRYVVGLALSLHDPRPAGRTELWQAFRIHPWSVRTIAVLAFSLLPQAFATRMIRTLQRTRAGLRRTRGVG
jgi:glycosyltransferase involved in cell wall biosynthesis